MTTKWLTVSVEKSREDPRRISFIASHEKIDRHSEVIRVAGIDLTEFLHNPIMLLSHDPKLGGVATVEHLRKTRIDGAPALVGEAVFPDRPRSNETLADVRAGLLGAVSIGFKGVELGPPILEGQHGATFVKTTLLEISLVALPACQTCLVTSKGVTKCASCAEDKEDIGLESMEVPPDLTGKAYPSCPRKTKCPTSALSHPDLCILTACPLKAGNQAGGKKHDDVLAGIIFPSMELDIEDEHQHVMQPVTTINRIILDTLRVSLRETVGEAVRRELNYYRGRVD